MGAVFAPTRFSLVSISVLRGFEKGWREGVGDQQRLKYSKNSPPELCSPTHKGAQVGDAQSRRKRNLTHESAHESTHEG